MALVDYFLNAPSSIVQLELIELTHPNFAQPYRIVRNAINGVTVTLEDLSVATFNYYPIRIESEGAKDNLDVGLRIDFGDLGELLPNALDTILDAEGNFTTKPHLIYRTYRSDDLTAPLYGPIELEITDISFNKTGSSFQARAPSLNISKTGELYTFDRFPMLRGFL